MVYGKPDPEDPKKCRVVVQRSKREICGKVDCKFHELLIKGGIQRDRYRHKNPKRYWALIVQMASALKNTKN